ncbi:hypothetical protein ACGFX2_17455 [Streptomyces goshikiensis]|uniref:hypothetical protein n=1 Tax=Streptomyces goshikiensis TaxID=1942 RepID=UPI0037192142
MTTEFDAARLLLTLHSRTCGDTLHIWDVADDPDWRHVEDSRTASIIASLVALGLASSNGTFACGTACKITAEGVTVAEQYARDRNDGRMRHDFAMDSLIDVAARAYPRTRVELARFVGSERMWFYDSVLELNEVEQAVRYLESKGLVLVERTPVQAHAIALTPLGIECGFENPISVRKFLSEQQQNSRPDINFNGPINGLQVGDNNTQNNTFGYDPQQLAEFAREVLAAAQTSDVPAEDRAAVVADIEALQAELNASQPEQGRVRRALQKAAQTAQTCLPALVWTGLAQGAAAGLGIPIGF